MKGNKNLNSLSPLEKESIWMPTLVFTNTKHRIEATFRNDSSFVTIEINENVKPKHPSTENIHNDDLFHGKDW